MKAFSIFKHPDDRLIVVKEGFSFPGLLAGGFWLFWHRIWMFGAVAIIVGLGAYALFPSPAGYILGIPYGHRFGLADIINIVTCGVVGVWGNEWRATALIDRGFECVATEQATTADGAKAAYLRRMAKGGDNEPSFMRREPI